MKWNKSDSIVLCVQSKNSKAPTTTEFISNRNFETLQERTTKNELQFTMGRMFKLTKQHLQVIIFSLLFRD